MQAIGSVAGKSKRLGGRLNALTKTMEDISREIWGSKYSSKAMKDDIARISKLIRELQSKVSKVEDPTVSQSPKVRLKTQW